MLLLCVVFVGLASMCHSFSFENPGFEPNLADEDLDVFISNFNDWAAAFPSSRNFLIAARVPRYRIGTLATSDIDKEQVYSSIPDAFIMSEKSAMSDAQLSPFLRQVARVTPQFNLLFHLLHEKYKGVESFWSAYISLLPRSFPEHPLYWSDALLGELKGTDVERHEIEAERKLRRRQYRQLLGMIQEAEEKLSASGSIPQSLLSLSERDFNWAKSILDSRTIWWNGKRHLVPMLDFVNCEEVSDRLHRTESVDGEAVTRAPAQFARGEQVFENYGQPNSIYFRYHGFVLEKNDHDCVNIGIGPGGMGGPDFEGPYPPHPRRRVTACFRVGKAWTKTALQHVAVNLGYSSPSFCSKSAENFKKCEDFVAKQAQSRLTAYPTLLEQDEAALAELPDDSHMRSKLALRLRIGEKKLLKEIIKEWTLPDSSESNNKHKDEL